MLTAAGATAFEVDRPDRKSQHTKGNTDPRRLRRHRPSSATGAPKSRDDVVEAVGVATSLVRLDMHWRIRTQRRRPRKCRWRAAHPTN
ncbi:hypothetical protein [Yinghuangia sp. YIM S09857]|uniref:hypothetical protein n=1 Tax=Yinghuangia sp. YIM S09857 TaxID=3436929 RepID=UPI003F53072C